MNPPGGLADVVTSAEAKVLAAILQGVSDDVAEIKDSMKTFGANLGDLTRLEVEHRSTREALQRSFEAVGKLENQFLDAHKQSVTQRDSLDKRMYAVEKELDPLKEMRKWVVGGVVGCCSITLLALGTLVIKPPAPINISLPDVVKAPK
jgi:hypothetical protein